MTDTAANSHETALAEEKEFDHLIKLLDDEDENIYSSVKDRFISHGFLSSNFLLKYLNDENNIIKRRANEIVSIINFEDIAEKFKALEIKKENDILEEGIFLISSYGYPGVNMNDYKRKLDRMVLDIESGLIKNNDSIDLTKPLEILNTINNYLFYEKGYKGNAENYYDEDNSYLNTVIDTRLGNPISLCIIYILISRRLHIPVSGINLPGHFILKYSGRNEEFFIDPFNKGVIISMKEAQEFVKKIGMSKDNFENIPYLKETSDKEIILRVLRNLAEIFSRKNDTVKSGQLERLMLCLA